MKEAAAVLEERLGMRLPPGVDFKPLARAVSALERNGFEAGRRAESGDALAARLARMPRVDLLRCTEYLLCHETYFFRHERHFEVLTHLLPRIVAERGDEAGPRHLRLLSAGCATGEEAYSLAIWARAALANHDGWTTRVIGVDRSERALQVARRGRYGEWSMRGNARTRVGDALVALSDDASFTLAPWLKGTVDFVALDLGEAAQVAALGPQEIVLCRNVLMYLTLHTAQRALNMLAEQLAPGGVLVCENHDLVGLRIPAALEVLDLSGDTALRRPRERAERGRASSDEHALGKRARRAPVRERKRRKTAPPPSPLPVTSPATMTEAEGHFHRALEADLSGHSSQAELELRVAIAVDPELYAARLHLGQLMMRLGRHAEGVALVRALRHRLADKAAHRDLVERCSHVLALHTGDP